MDQGEDGMGYHGKRWKILNFWIRSSKVEIWYIWSHILRPYKSRKWRTGSGIDQRSLLASFYNLQAEIFSSQRFCDSSSFFSEPRVGWQGQISSTKTFRPKGQDDRKYTFTCCNNVIVCREDISVLLKSSHWQTMVKSDALFSYIILKMIPSLFENHRGTLSNCHLVKPQ
jgi:hypothetical protein